MRILLVSDMESPYLWDWWQPGRLEGIDLIISCGDLDADYLSFLTTASCVPLLYVHGNHGGGYVRRPPAGCECIDDRLVVRKGLRILGLGGSPVYNDGPHQYSEAQMRRRIRRRWLDLRRAGGVDLVVSHAAPAGEGEGDDHAHRGFLALSELVGRERPRYLVHGHVHLSYGSDVPRSYRMGETTVVNAYERHVLELRVPNRPDR